VSFSPINFFSQAAPPSGFTIFDGKEFQFDVSDTTPGVWLPAFICPAAGNMKIEEFWLDQPTPDYREIRVTRASNGQQITAGWAGYNFDSKCPTIILTSGDMVEYRLPVGSTSASIHGMFD
jgi:hypothetical protein